MSRETFAPQVIYRTSDSGRNQPMDISEIRRRNLLALIDDETAKNGYRGARTRLALAELASRTP